MTWLTIGSQSSRITWPCMLKSAGQPPLRTSDPFFNKEQLMLLGCGGDHRLGCGADQAEELPDLADNLLMKFHDHLDLHDKECRPPTTHKIIYS